MANNRMWLVHDRSCTKVLLAKWWPTVGWQTWSHAALIEFFKRIESKCYMEVEPRLVYESNDMLDGYETVSAPLDTPPPSAK